MTSSGLSRSYFYTSVNILKKHCLGLVPTEVLLVVVRFEQRQCRSAGLLLNLSSEVVPRKTAGSFVIRAEAPSAQKQFLLRRRTRSFGQANSLRF